MQKKIIDTDYKPVNAIREWVAPQEEVAISEQASLGEIVDYAAEYLGNTFGFNPLVPDLLFTIVLNNEDYIQKVITSPDPVWEALVLPSTVLNKIPNNIGLTAFINALMHSLNICRQNNGLFYFPESDYGIRFADEEAMSEGYLPLFSFIENDASDEILPDQAEKQENMTNQVQLLCQNAVDRLEQFITNDPIIATLIRTGLLKNLVRPKSISQESVSKGNAGNKTKQMADAEASAYARVGNHAESEAFFKGEQMYRHIPEEFRGEAYHLLTELFYGTGEPEGEYMREQVAGFFSVFQIDGIPFPETVENADLEKIINIPTYFVTKLVKNYDLDDFKIEKNIMLRLLLVSFFVECSLNSGENGFHLTSRAQKDTIRLIEKYSMSDSPSSVFNATKVGMIPDPALFGEYERGEKHPELFLLHFPAIDQEEADRILSRAVMEAMESMLRKRAKDFRTAIWAKISKHFPEA